MSQAKVNAILINFAEGNEMLQQDCKTVLEYYLVEKDYENDDSIILE